MRTDGKIKDENPKYDINRQAAKMSPLSSGKFDKNDYLTGKKYCHLVKVKKKDKLSLHFPVSVKHLKNK